MNMLECDKRNSHISSKRHMIYISYEVSYDMGNLYVHQQQLSRRNRLSLEAVSKFIVLLIVRPVTWTTVARAEGQKPPLLQ